MSPVCPFVAARDRLPLKAFIVACLLVVLGTRAAFAQEDPGARSPRGSKVLVQGDAQAALGPLRGAYDLAPSPAAAGRLGQAEVAQQLWAPSEIHLREALASPSDIWVAQHRSALEKALSITRGHMGTITIKGSPRAAAVRIDGEFKGLLPLPRPLRLAVGDKQVEVTAEGYVPLRQTVTVWPGETTPVDANLLRVAAPPLAAGLATPVVPALAPSAVAAAPRWRQQAWVLLAGGLAVAAAGGYVLAVGDAGDRRSAALGLSAIGVGVGAAAAGLALFVVDF